jgi:peptidoglycan/LPS O-acetylase OafA/YrhL
VVRFTGVSSRCSAMSSKAHKHLPALDGIRAWAVFLVILYHSGVVTNVPGDLGVSAFFVLSGFLITWLLDKEYDRTGTVSLKEFYIRRTLRIFPAYYVFILVSLSADAVLGDPWSRGLIASAFSYTVNYYNAFQGHPSTSVAHAWSLAVEEQFYLLWPIAFLALTRKASSTRRQQALASAVLFILIWRSALFLLAHVRPSYVYNAFDARADTLAVGCFMALAREGKTHRRFEGFVRSSTWFPLITLALIWFSRELGSSQYHYTVGMTVDALLLGVFIIQMLGMSESKGWSWLNTRAVRWLGLISYPCYLWHLWGLDVGWHLFDPTVHKWAAFIAGYLATIAIAAGSYYIVEQPFLSLKERRAVRQTTTVSFPPASGNADVGLQ